jgi:hypothetical protein
VQLSLFDLAKCPKELGWSDYDEANGRVLIGAGQGKALTFRQRGVQGGNEDYPLSEENIPAHQHDTFLGDGQKRSTWGQTLNSAATINMSYLDDNRPIDFRMASPGQQASALLELLLKQSAGTLIIDQPEDDLDNRVIMRIVELLRTSKSTRQLIFTTHNANIVVNGGRG